MKGLAIFLAALVSSPDGNGKVLMTMEESLKSVFGDCRIERRTVYLTVEQQQSARQLAGTEVPSALVHQYIAKRKEQRLGIAYLDHHRVRTLPETALIAIDLEGQIKAIQVLTFDEPVDYLPRAAWFDQFQGRQLGDPVALGKDISAITGATLSARAVTLAARRVLALHQVIEENP